MKVIVIGPKGKMGKLITQVASEREDFELTAGVGPKGRDYIGADLGTVAMVGRELGVPVTDDLESVIDNCDVIIDFSTKEMAMDVLEQAVAHGKALVCGTTGFTEEEIQKFKEAAEKIPMLYAANTSKMVNVMNKLLETVVSILMWILRSWKCMISGRKMCPAGPRGKWARSWPMPWEKRLAILLYMEERRGSPQEFRGPLAITLCARVISQAAIRYFSAVWEKDWRSLITLITGSASPEEPVTVRPILRTSRPGSIRSRMYWDLRRQTHKSLPFKIIYVYNNSVFFSSIRICSSRLMR